MCLAWSEARVEQYFLNLLSGEENQQFESHVLLCRHCQERIEDEMNSLLALRRATMRGAEVRDWEMRGRLSHAL
jgi:hypothetical protein